MVVFASVRPSHLGERGAEGRTALRLTRRFDAKHYVNGKRQIGGRSSHRSPREPFGDLLLLGPESDSPALSAFMILALHVAREARQRLPSNA